MAITVTLDFPRAQRLGRGVAKMISGSFALSNAYPTGGEAANGANGVTRHFKSCKEVICEQTSGYVFQFASNKIKVMYPTNAVTPAGAIAAHYHTENVDANYTANANTANANTTFAGNASNAAAGVEVANGANLAAVNAVRFVAYGY